MKTSQRYSLNSLALGEQDTQGRLFVTENHGFIDLSNVEIVGASIDTVRQLYYGIPLPDTIKLIDDAVRAGDDFLTINDTTGSTMWHISRMGKTARYRYKLQNNEVGIVILYGSYFQTLDHPGQHLKFELSPHFLTSHDVNSIASRLHFYVAKLLDAVEPKGCAVHLACDYQGFNMPDNFIQTFSTYSRTLRTYDGLSNIDLSDISESIASYGGKGQGKNYLIGKASSVQFCIYDKSHEIIKSDKVDYFHHQWGVYSLGIHNSDKPTWRVEARLHHQIIREFGHSLGKTLESFFDVIPYLTDIWRYALSKNRLNLDTKSKFIHPFWQLLMEDVYFYEPPKNVKIARKKKRL